MYDLRPTFEFSGAERGVEGWASVGARLKAAVEARVADATVLVIECYPGVSYDELQDELFPLLSPCKIVCADDCAMGIERVQERIADCITDDRVFGILSHYRIEQFYEDEALRRATGVVASTVGLTIVYGFGASLVCDPDLLVYADLPRWEIQCRHRGERLCNWKTDNEDEDALRKFKRGYFFEWRMADRHKRELMGRIDFFLDTTHHHDPRMVSGQAFRSALAQLARRPFRLVPYFDSSVWGGHWMQERFGLDPSVENFGWGFDGVPEENSLLIRFGDTSVELPALDLVLSHPDELLGPKVHARFGAEFPIRFDYLDTMGGGNLSLQVHPLTGYIQDRFGMAYTQDESYYILDATDDSHVYLGVKDGVDRDGMFEDLRRANRGERPFPDERYVNTFSVRKHDHVHIPAGTVHCGGSNTVILEISATPYIFTFKLWDWGRLGLDGLPRPVHLEHGKRNVLMTRDTTFCLERLIDRSCDDHEDISSEAGVRVERTGLNELEFIETRRHWFSDVARLETHESVNALNLVEGSSAVVKSVDGSFDPFWVNYGETFIVPECVGSYLIENTGDKNEQIAIIQAFVRS